MHTTLQSECAKLEAYTLLWTESTSEQLLVLSRLRTEGELPKMADNQWVHESPAFQRLELSHATVCTQASESKWARPEASTFPWTEATSETELVLSWLRTEGELTEMTRNPLVRESSAFQRLEPTHATVCTRAFDQSARDPRHVHCLGLNRLRNRS